MTVNLDFIDEMITRCDRAQEVEWIEQDTDSEEEVDIDGDTDLEESEVNDDTDSEEEEEEEEDVDESEDGTPIDGGTDSEDDIPTHCDNGNCGRPLIVRKESSCYQCGDHIVLEQKCIYCPRCDDVQVFLCVECEERGDLEEDRETRGSGTEGTVYSVNESEVIESEEEYEDSDTESGCSEASSDGKPWFTADGPVLAVYDIKQHEKCAICNGENDEEWEEQVFFVSDFMLYFLVILQ